MLDSALPTQSYLAMLTAVEESANIVRKQSPKTASEVAQQSGSFYEQWFTQFYFGRGPQIDALWPFLAWAMDALPLGLRQINPLQMTIAEWNQAHLEQQTDRQKVISLERLGFRRDAERLSEPTQSDDLIRAMLQSIRKRGYEKGRVILVPAPESLTRTWLPSENIACQMMLAPSSAVPFLPVPKIESLKYLLVEGSDSIAIDQIMSGLVDRPSARIALFGVVPSTPNTRLPYPYIDSPRSLDDLVERVDSLPDSYWNPNWAPQQRS